MTEQKGYGPEDDWVAVNVTPSENVSMADTIPLAERDLSWFRGFITAFAHHDLRLTTPPRHSFGVGITIGRFQLGWTWGI